MVVVAAIAIVVTTRTPFGRRVYAVGGNDRAAVLSGIRVTRITIAVYVISGACAGLAGLLLTSELGAAYPDTATTYELNAIAAAVLGGTALSGGRGTIIGTVMGAFVIGFLSDGLVLIGVSTFWQSVVKGARDHLCGRHRTSAAATPVRPGLQGPGRHDLTSSRDRTPPPGRSIHRKAPPNDQKPSMGPTPVRRRYRCRSRAHRRLR